MTRVLLISAGPTPWDVEGRLGGNPTLPLTTDGEIQLQKTLAALDHHPVTAIFTCVKNQACDQAAKLVARHYNVRVRDCESLESMSMGLWQGLTREELRFRFPTVFPEWEDCPLNVNPPQGESLEAAAARIREGLRKILKRNRGGTIALVLRPVTLQIALGLLRGEPLHTLVAHLHDTTLAQTMDVPDNIPADPIE